MAKVLTTDMRFFRRLAFFSLPLLSISFCVCASADTISKSTEYISPYGDYTDLTIRQSLVTGVAATGAGLPANAAQSTMTIYGDATIRGGTLSSAGSEFHVDSIFEVKRPGTLLPAFSTYPKTAGNSHWFGINLDPSYLSGTPPRPPTEFYVNGDIYATAFRASPGGTIISTGANDNDFLLYFKMGTISGVPVVQLGSSAGTDVGGYNIPESVARFSACPKIVLNGGGVPADTNYSKSNVIIGASAAAGAAGAWGSADNDPSYRLQVGPAGGGGLYAIITGQQVMPSSREYKKDISLLSAPDLKAIYSRIDDMNVVRYRYKDASSDSSLRIGILVEEAPKEILTDNGKTLSTGDTIGFLIAGIKGLREENLRLERQIRELENQTSLSENKLS